MGHWHRENKPVVLPQEQMSIITASAPYGQVEEHMSLAEKAVTTRSCLVNGCVNSQAISDLSVSYFSFPNDETLRQQWVEACGWKDCSIDVNTAYICAIHFEDSAYKTNIKIVDFLACYTKILREDAVPTMYLPENQFIIKDHPRELSNEEEMAVYTINPPNEDESLVFIHDDSEQKLFDVQPSSSKVKLETKEVPMECDTTIESENYLVDTYKTLKKEIGALREELELAKMILKEKEGELLKINEEYNELQGRTTNKKDFSDKDQLVILSKVFSKSQIKILFGKKKIYWTNDDLAVGYTIRHLSNKRCYTYLTKNLKIPLPGMSSIKRWVSTKQRKGIKGKKGEQ